MLPELQAEIDLGLENSERGVDLMELLRLFLAQGDEWAEADDDIRADTAERERVLPPGVDALQRSVSAEVNAWQAAWRGDMAKGLNWRRPPGPHSTVRRSYAATAHFGSTSPRAGRLKLLATAAPTLRRWRRRSARM